MQNRIELRKMNGRELLRLRIGTGMELLRRYWWAYLAAVAVIIMLLLYAKQ